MSLVRQGLRSAEFKFNISGIKNLHVSILKNKVEVDYGKHIQIKPLKLNFFV